jgi:hypothetical protein
MATRFELGDLTRHRQNWTLDEDRLLAQELARGASVREVAQALERSQTAIHARAIKMGLLVKRARSEVRPRIHRRRSASFFLS